MAAKCWGSELVFQRYGDQYFLHEVLCPATASTNVDIPASRLEKRERTEAKLHQTVAKNVPSTGTIIEVAMR